MVPWGRGWRSAVVRRTRALASYSKALTGCAVGVGAMREAEFEEIMEEAKFKEADTRVDEG
jgi:hypothetical protein